MAPLIVRSLLLKLSSLVATGLNPYYVMHLEKYLEGLEIQLEAARSELDRIRRVHSEGEAPKDWSKNIRYVRCGIENTLVECIAEAKREAETQTRPYSFSNTKFCHQIGERIKMINETLNWILTQMLKSHSKLIHSNKCCRVRDLYLKCRSHLPDTCYRDLDLESLVAMLLRDEGGRNGACINYLDGEGSVEKTTLALKAMKYREVTSAHQYPPTVNQILKELRRLLDGKKFLLVLDDIQGLDIMNHPKREPCLENFLKTANCIRLMQILSRF
ncbi:hypothetical protein AMTR_s00049p00159340 [Amborella trichopoda]|uniref:Disease resistance N-terminal domain-containing protein n=1 Tax=Amborella trichopoda TaxID=13333 RepID=W1Q0V1_AMBTC|nr:hypothetical protein AMTR_s00049p00159340 [Amborella trichopoda]